MGDIVDHDIGLSYLPVSLFSQAGQYNPMPHTVWLTISPSQGLRIWPLLCVQIQASDNKWSTLQRSGTHIYTLASTIIQKISVIRSRVIFKATVKSGFSFFGDTLLWFWAVNSRRKWRSKWYKEQICLTYTWSKKLNLIRCHYNLLNT